MSASASAHLFYGLTVRACDLVAAGKAFELVGPALSAVKMMSRRRERGRLVGGEGGSGAALVPVEVWEMIRKALVDVGISDGRSAVQADLHCQRCADSLASGGVSPVRDTFGSGTINRNDDNPLAEAKMVRDHVRAELERERVDHLTDDDWIEHRGWPNCICEGDPDADVDEYWVEELYDTTVS